MFCWINRTGWSEGILRCPRARRKPPRRSSSRDDRSKRDRVHWWVEDSHIRRPWLTLPHTLWSKTQCFSISWACFHHCWKAKKEQDQITASSFLSSFLWWTLKKFEEKTQENDTFVLFLFYSIFLYNYQGVLLCCWAWCGGGHEIVS